MDKIADSTTLMLYVMFNLEISHVKDKLKTEDFNSLGKIESKFFLRKTLCFVILFGTQIPTVILSTLSYFNIKKYPDYLLAILILRSTYTLFIAWFFGSIAVPTITYFAKNKKHKGSKRNVLVALLYTVAFFSVLS